MKLSFNRSTTLFGETQKLYRRKKSSSIDLKWVELEGGTVFGLLELH